MVKNEIKSRSEELSPEEKLGRLVKEYRERNKLLLHQLAEKVGVNYTHISYIEKGQRIPSEELLEALVEALGQEDKEKDYLRKKMFFCLAQAKAPKQIRDNLKLKTDKDIPISGSMPKDFIEMLRDDIKRLSPEEIEKTLKIPYATIRKVLDGEIQLSRLDVIKIAKKLKKDVNTYLIKANYIPEEFDQLMSKSSVLQLMRSIKDLPPEDVDKLISSIETILKTIKK